MGEGEDVGDGVEICDPDGVDEREEACEDEPVTVDDCVGDELIPWLPVDETDAVVTWLDVTLEVTLGVGVAVNTIETVWDGVAEAVALNV